jgi:hypothetical protein
MVPCCQSCFPALITMGLFGAPENQPAAYGGNSLAVLRELSGSTIVRSRGIENHTLGPRVHSE